MSYKILPLVYSCSGCSSAAQLANALAVRLDREKRAEMSCIAGVGGNVPGLVAIAKSGRPIIGIDGCPLNCVTACLNQRGLSPTRHVTLSELGIRKRQHGDYSQAEFEMAYQALLRIIEEHSAALRLAAR